MDVLLCSPSGARFSLIDSCDELRVYLWAKLRHKMRENQASFNFFQIHKQKYFQKWNFFRTSDKSSRSWLRTVSQKSRKRSLARFLWFHFISSSLGCIPFCEKSWKLQFFVNVRRTFFTRLFFVNIDEIFKFLKAFFVWFTYHCNWFLCIHLLWFLLLIKSSSIISEFFFLSSFHWTYTIFSTVDTGVFN